MLVSNCSDVLVFCLCQIVAHIWFCRKPCKVGYRYLEDGTKVRVSRGIGASGSIIPRPEILKIRTTPRPTVGNVQIFHVPLSVCARAYVLCLSLSKA